MTHKIAFGSSVGILCYSGRGVAGNLGKGVLDYACKARAQNFKPHPLINGKVEVQIVTENAF